MKVAAILEDKITVGGGFNQSLNAIMQTYNACEGVCDFEIITFHRENIQYLEKIGLNAKFLKTSIIDRIFIRATRSLLGQTLIDYIGYITPFEKKLIDNNVDIIYFLTQSPTAGVLRKLNYIATIFDLCHRDMLEFPEVGYSSEFYSRENHFKRNLTRAFLVIADSTQLSKSVAARYAVDGNRILVSPFSPSPFISEEISVDKATVLDNYELTEGYFFYPAQFWPHKNHARLLEALYLLNDKGLEFDIVFSGGDKGNKDHILKLVQEYSLEKQVRFLDFVPPEHMRGLYEGALAVVMPTYFGPTNLPPLEAWSIGKPLIYSTHLQNHAGTAAIYVNPDDHNELAEAMKACSDENVRSKLQEAGYLRLNQIKFEKLQYEAYLKNRLFEFKKRRQCWS